jgi:hypothetical protein
MSRLASDIDVLQLAADTASLVIYPGQDNRSFPEAARTTVATAALITLGDTLEQLRQQPREYSLIDYEAVWLLRATEQLALRRSDRDDVKAERFQKLCEFLRGSVETDLRNARKSLETMS